MSPGGEGDADDSRCGDHYSCKLFNGGTERLSGTAGIIHRTQKIWFGQGHNFIR